MEYFGGKINHNRLFSFAVILLSATVLSGCSNPNSGEENIPKLTASADYKKFVQELTSFTVNLDSNDTRKSNEAAVAVAKVLQDEKVLSFSFDNSKPGNLGVKISDIIDKATRDKIVEQIKKINSAWEVKKTTSEAWKFVIAGPLAAPAPEGRLAPITGQEILNSLSSLLTAGFQISVTKNNFAEVSYSGPLAGGEQDIEKARLALANALDADDEKVVVKPAVASISDIVPGATTTTSSAPSPAKK